MTGLPLRARLAGAFALAMIVVLAAAGLFVYLRLESSLDESLDDTLQARSASVASLVRASGARPPDLRGAATAEAEDAFTQVSTTDGRVLAASGGARGQGLTRSELRRAAASTVAVERHVAGIEGTARVLARSASDRPGSPIVAAGQSLADRDETLDGVVTSFAVGGPIAVVLASVLGYLLATAGLAPIEAMRRRAAEVSLTGGESERLPLPKAHDEVRRLGETLNEMLDRLRASFERERRFVADASHELRTPIAVVKAELDGALRTQDFGPDVRAALVAAVAECDHLAQLAEDLLIIARASEGKLPVRAETLRARDVLDGARERFADRAREHGREIRVEAPDELTLHADPQRLRQALGNLVDNALRHGGGKIGLTARAARGGVELEVSDEGEGFAAGVAERPFERFTRGDTARTRGGAGLGLAIVKAIAEAHGGSATIVHGAGTVRISLPAHSHARLS